MILNKYWIGFGAKCFENGEMKRDNVKRFSLNVMIWYTTHIYVFEANGECGGCRAVTE